jgi:hypothetical protein
MIAGKIVFLKSALSARQATTMDSRALRIRLLLGYMNYMALGTQKQGGPNSRIIRPSVSANFEIKQDYQDILIKQESGDIEIKQEDQKFPIKQEDQGTIMQQTT